MPPKINDDRHVTLHSDNKDQLQWRRCDILLQTKTGVKKNLTVKRKTSNCAYLSNASLFGFAFLVAKPTRRFYLRSLSTVACKAMRKANAVLYPNMHERIYNDFLLAEHRLQRVLIQWKLLQPRFAAKKTASLSPETRSLLILSLKQQHQHVAQALRKLYEVKACWDAYKKMAICFTIALFKKARVKIANSLEPKGAKVINQIEILLLEFQNPPTTPTPFNDLPYEFQKRLVQLLPPKDVTTFKSCGNTAFKTVKKHLPNCIFVHSLFVVYFNFKLKEILSSKKNSHKVIDKIAMNDFNFFKPEMAPCYVSTTLSIYLGSQEAYSKAMEFISGDFETIKIYGAKISWKQAFDLINKSPCVRHASYKFGKIEKVEYNDFFVAMMLLLQTNNIELLVFRHWSFFSFLEEIQAFLNCLDIGILWGLVLSIVIIGCGTKKTRTKKGTDEDHDTAPYSPGHQVASSLQQKVTKKVSSHFDDDFDVKSKAKGVKMTTEHEITDIVRHQEQGIAIVTSISIRFGQVDNEGSLTFSSYGPQYGGITATCHGDEMVAVVLSGDDPITHIFQVFHGNKHVASGPARSHQPAEMSSTHSNACKQIVFITDDMIITLGDDGILKFWCTSIKTDTKLLRSVGFVQFVYRNTYLTMKCTAFAIDAINRDIVFGFENGNIAEHPLPAADAINKDYSHHIVYEGDQEFHEQKSVLAILKQNDTVYFRQQTNAVKFEDGKTKVETTMPRVTRNPQICAMNGCMIAFSSDVGVDLFDVELQKLTTFTCRDPKICAIAETPFLVIGKNFKKDENKKHVGDLVVTTYDEDTKELEIF
uniref:WD_REPEATS_REGION domain-containing protein n=1 Tax=Panagrellus redivivus TaxID=6233 RepID=A0A7E4UU37_PANRE